MKLLAKSAFHEQRRWEPIYTGGQVLVDKAGRWLVTAAGDEVFVTDCASGERLCVVPGDSEVVTAMALRVRRVSVDANGDSLDGDHYAEQVQLVTASRSLQLTLWELPIGTKIDHRDASTPAENTRQSSISVNARKLRSWKAHEAPVLAMAFDQTGTLLATGSADSTIRVFDVDRAACTHNLRGHRGLVSTLLFHPEAERWLLLSGGDDGRVKVWDLMTKKCRATLESHVSVVRAISVSDDGWTVVSGARDKVVCVWSLRDFQLVSTIPVLETIEAVGVVGGGSGTSGDSTDIRFYTAGDKGTVRVWSTASGQCIYEQTLAVASTNSEGHAVTSALYLSATNTLVTTTVDHNINFYRLESASSESITLERIRSVAGYCEEIADIAFVGPDRDSLAVVSNSEQLRVFDVNASGCTIVYGHSEPILCLDVSRDGRVIATGSKDKTARVWAYDDTSANWECIAVCAGHAEAVTGVSFSRKQADGVRFLMTVSKDRTVKRWDLSQLLGAEERVKTFYTNKAHEKDINAVTVAPNDRFFATASQDKLAKIWNVETGEVHGVLKGHRRGVWTVRFSPVDQVVATGSGDKTIKLWSLGDLTCLKTLEGHTNSVVRLDYLTLGTQLFTTGSDGLAKLWTVKSGECVATMDSHDDKAWALSVREQWECINGEQEETAPCLVATAGADAQIILYQDATKEEHSRGIREREELLVLEQDLSNFLLRKDYRSAILLAMRLGKPGRLASILGDVLMGSGIAEDPAHPFGTHTDVEQVLATLKNAHLDQLLTYVRDWNTNAKYGRIAQCVLNVLLRRVEPARLLQLPSIKEVLDALLPYSERHFSRVDALLTKSWLVEYTLEEMDALVEK